MSYIAPKASNTTFGTVTTSGSGTEAQTTDEKGQPNGYASLDGAGLVPVSQLPASTGGDFVGPAGAVADNLVAFDTATGKLGKDSGIGLSEVVTLTAVQTLTNKRRAYVCYSTSPQTLIEAEEVVTINAATVPILVNLPTAVGLLGKSYVIKKIDGTSNAVTVDPNGTETIDNSPTYVIVTPLASIEFISDGSNWFIIG